MKTRSKRLWLAAALAALGLVVVWLCQVQTTPAAYESLIRFHVVANSDSVDDQAVKLKVRDALLADLERELATFTTVEEAEAWLTSEMPRIVNIAENVLADEGYAYPVTASLTEESFPTKGYGKLVLPAGEYRALRVNLGEAAGKNWWCVLFPPLCFVDISQNIAVAEEQRSAIVMQDGEIENGERIRLKLKVLEFLNQ